jgi:hypothetical protein
MMDELLRWDSVWHVSRIKNVESIMKSGIVSNEQGDIFVINNRDVAEDIASSQVFAKEFALFSVDPRGISGEVIFDECSELISHQRQQFIIKQPRIEPQFIRHAGNWRLLSSRIQKLGSGWHSINRCRFLLRISLNPKWSTNLIKEELREMAENFDSVSEETVEKEMKHVHAFIRRWKKDLNIMYQCERIEE